MARTLDVYLHNALVGNLIQDAGGQMVFEYVESWLNAPGAAPLSQSLPLRKKRFSRKECRGFFAGILPEESKREIIARNLGISARNDYAMLERIGGECAGAVTFIPTGDTLPAGNYGYRTLSSQELAALLRELPKRPLLAGDEGIRLSLAGAQDKLPVRIESGDICLPLGGAPPGEARTDFDIFVDIARRLGVRDELYPGWKTSHDAYLEWQQVSKGRMCDYSPFTWQQIEDEGGVQWGGERLYQDGIFPNSDGRARLHCVPCEPCAEQPNGEYPFVLNTGRTVEHWNTRTKTAQVDLLNTMVPHAWLEMNPVDAERLQLTAHDKVTVISRRSRVPNLELRITGIVAPGQVFMPFHFSEHNSNRVTLGAFDPISREPNFKQCAVRVERTGFTVFEHVSKTSQAVGRDAAVQ